MVNKIPYTHLQKLVRRYFRPIQRALDVYNNGINKKFVDDLIEFYKSKTQKDIAEDLLEVEILNRLNKENISSQELEELIVELQNDAVRSSIFEQNKRANIKKFETEENEDKKYGLLLAILLLGGYSSSVDKLKDKYTVNQAFNKLKTVEPKTLPPTPAEYESAIISGIREKMYNFDATSKKN